MSFEVRVSRLVVLSGLALSASSMAACATTGTGAANGVTNDPMAGIPARQLFENGVTLVRAGDLVRAEQYLIASMQRGMPEAQVLPVLMSTCVQASRYRAAVSHATPYLERNPRDWRLRYLLGTILSAIDEHQAARRQFEAVIAENTRHASAHFDLAMLLRSRFNDPVTADTHFRQYLEIEPQGQHADEARLGLLRQVTQ